jgi:hypothetical protein
MLSIATLGVGFAARPPGALVVGAYAHRVGRWPLMFFSLFAMGLAIRPIP